MYVHVYKITNLDPSREMSELMKQYSRTKLRMLYVIKLDFQIGIKLLYRMEFNFKSTREHVDNFSITRI